MRSDGKENPRSKCALECYKTSFMVAQGWSGKCWGATGWRPAPKLGWRDLQGGGRQLWCPRSLWHHIPLWEICHGLTCSSSISNEWESLLYYIQTTLSVSRLSKYVNSVNVKCYCLDYFALILFLSLLISLKIFPVLWITHFSITIYISLYIYTFW